MLDWWGVVGFEIFDGFSGSDSSDEFVEGVADGFFWLWFGGVGTDHASGFTAGPDDVAVFGGAVVDDFFEPVEDLFAGQAGMLTSRLVEFG